nr:hypothetical protein [Tanacetum cinerariifolium]
MLDRTDFASWKQRIRLYCQGKENRVNILKSIDEGPCKIGTVRETLAESTEGAPQFGPKRSRVYSDLTSEEKDRFVTTVKLSRGLRDTNYDQLYAYIKQHETHAKENKMTLERFSQPTVDPLALLSNVSNPHHYSPSASSLSSTQVSPPLADSSSLAEDLIENITNTLALLTQSYRTFLPQTNNQLRTSSNARNQATVQDSRMVGQARPGQARTIKCYNCNGTGHIAWNCTQPKRPQNSKYFKDKMFLMQAQENRVALDVEQLLFLADVDEAPTAQTMFMANLSSADPVTDEARPSYDSNILYEVQDHNQYMDFVFPHQEEHVMHDSVQLDHVVNSHVDYTSDSNMILYDQYVKNNEVPVVHNNVSSVLNDAFMMIYNDMCEPPAQSVSNPSRNTVVKNSLTAELATYKEHVELYEQRATFELTKREQKINEQLSCVISDRNFKEETLKRELHSIKLQLASTINHNKSMVKEVSFLKKDFKQKENKYLEDFLDMKYLKEKVKDKLIKQDQSLQTVHMLCKPRPNPNELNRVAIGYKNPLCLTRAKQVQPALYNGHEIIKDNHKPTIVHDIEDTLEIADITRKKMNDKMNDPECVTRKVKISPHDYSKENFLATFTPQKQLTPEQIFWSNELMKLKSEALKEWTKALTKEVKEMKDVFEELEAEVAQYAVDRKRDAIKLKNLIIANDNLIAECLSQEVFYVATNSELNVARFIEIHVANTTAEVMNGRLMIDDGLYGTRSLAV